jgi:hypothetical protein
MPKLDMNFLTPGVPGIPGTYLNGDMDYKKEAAEGMGQLFGRPLKRPTINRAGYIGTRADSTPWMAGAGLLGDPAPSHLGGDMRTMYPSMATSSAPVLSRNTGNPPTTNMGGTSWTNYTPEAFGRGGSRKGKERMGRA